MLPNSGFKWKKKPLIQVWRKLSEGKENVKLEEYDPATCISFFEEALKNNEVLFRLVYQGSILAKYTVGISEYIVLH